MPASVICGLALVELMVIWPEVFGITFQSVLARILVPPIPGALLAGTATMGILSVTTLCAGDIPLRARARWAVIAALVTLGLGPVVSAVTIGVWFVYYFTTGGH